MDPNTTLQSLRTALDALDAGTDPDAATDLAEAARALDWWLTRGGFLPADWRNAVIN